MPTFCGSPDVPHLGPDEDSLTFTAVLSDYRYAKGVAYHWTCEDGNVVIASPNSRETQISFTTMPSWASATLAVTATVGTNELCSTLADFTYGTNDTPQVYFGFSVPNAVLLNSNRTDNAKLGRLSLSFSSDDDRRGSLRLSCTSGDDRIALWGTSNRTMGVSLPMDFQRLEVIRGSVMSLLRIVWQSANSLSPLCIMEDSVQRIGRRWQMSGGTRRLKSNIGRSSNRQHFPSPEWLLSNLLPGQMGMWGLWILTAWPFRHSVIR